MVKVKKKGFKASFYQIMETTKDGESYCLQNLVISEFLIRKHLKK